MLGDAAGAILKDGELVAAVEESKLVRRRTHWGGRGELPEHAIADLPGAGGRHAGAGGRGGGRAPAPASPIFTCKLRAQFPNSRIVVVEHHLAHAASAYYPSPFDEATVLTLDRAGDFRCGSRWHASRHRASRSSRSSTSPDSLGDLYGRVTELLGFEANADEHKVQWLSVSRRRPLPGPVPRDPRARRRRPAPRPLLLQHGTHRRTAASARTSSSGSAWPTARRSPRRCGRTWPRAFSRPSKTPCIRMAGAGENLCLAGGLGLNALLVSALESRSGFRNVFVQPAAGNAGTAIGAVLRRLARRLPPAAARRPANPVPRARLQPRPRSSRCWRTASCASTTCSPPTK